MDTNKDYMKLIMPSIQDQQSTKMPQNASISKSYNLLHNTFSIEVYEQFEKHKKERKDNSHVVKQIAEHKKMTQDKLISLTEKENNQQNEFKNLSFREKMETMRDLRASREELKSYLKELKGKLKHVSTFDLNFFQKLEEGSKETENMQSKLN